MWLEALEGAPGWGRVWRIPWLHMMNSLGPDGEGPAPSSSIQLGWIRRGDQKPLAERRPGKAPTVPSLSFCNHPCFPLVVAL